MSILVQFQHRLDTAANWTSANPVLLAAEIGLDTTSGRWKAGDGTTAWNSLPYSMTKLLSGTGTPSAGLGVDGDVYVDVTPTAQKLFGPKAAGSWGAGQSIVGSTGTTGTTGATGPGVPTGGTTGQYLRKTSGVDFATAFAGAAQVKADLAVVSTDLSDFPTAVTGVVGDLDVYDNFARTVAAGGWGSANTGQAWTILSAVASDLSVAGGVGIAAMPTANTISSLYIEAGSSDQDIYTDLTWASTVTGAAIDLYTMGRDDGTGNNCYLLQVDLTTSGTWSASLAKFVAGVLTYLTFGFATGTFTPGGFVRTRLQCRGTTLSAKAWLATATEPSAWQTTVTDSALTTGTKTRLYISRPTGNTSATPTAKFDNFHVYVPTDAVVNIAPSAVENRHLYPAAANTVKANATGSAANPTDVALTANQFLARSSTGDIAAKAITDAGLAWLALTTTAAETAALNAATVALQGMQSAVDKQKEDNVWLDVTTDFGANNLIKTTGTDQTTKINNIITAAPAGAVLYWPVGTYDTQGGHTYGKLLLMKGQTRSGSVINCTHATNTLFTMTAGADGSGFQTIRLSANTAALRTAGYAIDFGAIPNAFIQQTDILFHWGGVRSAGPLQFMDDANIREMGANAANGNSILVTSTGDRYIRRVTMDQAARTVDFSGIRINQCSSCVITDSNIIHCGTALHVNANAGAGTAIASVYSANTFYDTSVIGANITCATGSDTVQRATFVRCWFSTMTTAGVQINHANVNSVDFIGCEFYQEGFGIDVTACTEWSVRSSRFAGCTTNAIRTAAGSTHSFTISDNFIGNGAGFGANAQGINIQAGTYARYQIIDNRGLDTNTTPGIIDLGVVPVTNQKNVSNNMGCVLKGALQLSTSAGAAVTTGRVATVGTAETYMVGARIPANGVSAGQTFKISVVAQATAACNVNFATKAGAAGTTADTSIDTHAATAVLINGYVVYECLATVVALGATGNVAGVGWQNHVGSTVGKVAAAEVIATAPTTAAWFLSVTALSSVAAAISIRAVAIEAL